MALAVGVTLAVGVALGVAVAGIRVAVTTASTMGVATVWEAIASATPASTVASISTVIASGSPDEHPMSNTTSSTVAVVIFRTVSSISDLTE